MARVQCSTFFLKGSHLLEKTIIISYIKKKRTVKCNEYKLSRMCHVCNFLSING